MIHTERQPGTSSLSAALATLLLCAAPALAAEPWTAPLQSGGQVEVDPRTNRPVLTRDGRQTQLWDGVHRLEDGSVIRIEGGRVVPTTDMLVPPPAPSESATTDTEGDSDQPAGEPIGEPVTGASPCEQLVIRVCGAARTCWREPPCEAARQLREMEQEEWLKGADPHFVTESGKQCREAMTNDFFAPCR
ncbi:conserved exported hypothetical protein [Thiocapsa sp. KS1]|nr:hypothetical protein [Thiocapsa sp. KS1]CRI67584.1 conserved exported hypothetical protein [Thiocapsa sp. KS1]